MANEAQVLKKFASDVIGLANQVKAISAMAVNLKKMQKEASAKEASLVLNDVKLRKAASAVASLYGDRAAVNADSLIRIWSGNHNTMVDSLCKLASDAVASRVDSGANQMVTVKRGDAVKKTASDVGGNKPSTHSASFDSIFGL